MSNVNGLITAPVTTKDIQNVLGTKEIRLSQLCTHPDINKYSIKKPIPYPTRGERCSNFKGTESQNNEGIFYGLRVGNVSLGMGIHDADWEYIRPSGTIGVEPWRKLDFDGYLHNAKPTLSGYSSECQSGKVIYTSGAPITAVLEWNRDYNEYGVDIFSCVRLNVDMTSWYLCILIDGWMRALINNDALNIVAPVVYNGVECKRFTCPELPDELKQNGEHKVSFFLADLDTEVPANYKTQWLDVSIDLKPRYAPVTIPNAVGYIVEFSSTMIEYITATIDIVATSDAIEGGISISEFTDIEQPYVVTLEFGGAMASKKTFTGGTSTSILPLLRWGVDELGLRVEFGSGDIYEYTISLYGSNSLGELVKVIDTTSGTIVI